MLRLYAVLGLVGLPCVALADEPVMLKIRRPAVGDRIRLTGREESEQRSKLTMKGNSEEKSLRMESVVDFTDEVVALGEDLQLLKLTRTYKKADLTREGKPIKLPLLDGPIAITHGKQGYTYSLAGKSLEGDALEFLQKEFPGSKPKRNRADLFLPGKPVQAGDSWKLDLEKLALEILADAKVDLEKSSGSAKLVSVTEKAGQRRGVSTVSVILVMQKLTGANGQMITLKPGSQMTLDLRFEGVLDGSDVDHKTDLKTTTKLIFDLPNLELTTEIQNRFQFEHKLVK